MTSVRETIQLLAQILVENGTSEITAETFRQAKFNKNEATPVLWKLLFELVYFCKYGIIDESAIKAETELSLEERCVYVKQELQHLGYLLPDFAALNYHGQSGSRELLLALAWLMCHENILENFMQKCTSPIEDDSRLYYEKMFKDDTNMPLFESGRTTEPYARVQKLLLLNGKLQMNLRRLYALQIQDANLSHKVHESTNGISMTNIRNHLTPFEVRLLRYPNHLQKMLDLLEKDNERLQNLLLWKEKEHIFWSWMESVLDLKVKEKEEDSTIDDVKSVPVYLNIPTNCNKHISNARKQLVETILQYEEIIDQLEALWAKKHEEISEQDLDNLLTSINMEIALQRASLSLSTTANLLKPKKGTQFILKDQSKKSVRPSKHLAPAFLGGQGDCPGIDINIAIIDIEKRIEGLEHDLLVDQGICKTEMDKLSATVPKCIFIPPLALKGRD